MEGGNRSNDKDIGGRLDVVVASIWNGLIEHPRGSKYVCSIMCSEYSVSEDRYPRREIMARLYVPLWLVLVRSPKIYRTQAVQCVGWRP